MFKVTNWWVKVILLALDLSSLNYSTYLSYRIFKNSVRKMKLGGKFGMVSVYSRKH